MNILAQSNLRRSRMVTAAMATAMGAALCLAAPGATSAHATPKASHTAVTQVNCAPTPPWVSTYTFANHLKVEGGCFTENGRVYVTVKHNNGTVYFKRWVTARDHPFLAGGWINVDTLLRGPCTGTPKNGYARAYDSTTEKWSPRFPVSICIRFDDNN